MAMWCTGGAARACETGPALDMLASWASSCAHPLCGRVLEAATGRLSGEEGRCEADAALTMRRSARAAAANGLLLLGEIHDNPHHHEFRARLITELAATAKPALAFEQFRADQQAALDAAAGKTLDELKAALGWRESGWSSYDYDSLLSAARDAALPLYAGDVPRAAIMKVAKEGDDALAADERSRLGLDVALPAALAAAARTEIAESHCGLLPEQAFAGMTAAQRYRDAHLADVALRGVQERGGAILLAGNGHVRSDRGVPWYVRQRSPATNAVSVLLVEVEPGATDPARYLPRGPDGAPAADFVVFTPRQERGDPCREMRESFRGRR
jgi:uncharacterized iron-regulated protein